MHRLLYILIYPFLWLLAWLPLPVLYLFSDISFLLLRYVLRYRHKVIANNFANAFPEKSSKERGVLMNKYYLFLCDCAVESIKLIHMSEHEMKRRFVFKNIDLILDLASKGHNITGVFGHYGNWEWICSLPLWVNNKITISTLYKPLSNPFFDRLYLKIRSRFGTRCFPKQQTLRSMINMEKEERRYILAFIADQTPSHNNLHYWTNFLNQDTPFLTGWETLTAKRNNSLIYLDVRRVRRGYYTATFELMSEHIEATPDFKWTENYVHRLEETIDRAPAYWLWSHRRWKHKRQTTESK